MRSYSVLLQYIRTLLWGTDREILLAKLVFPEGTWSNFLVLKTLADRDAVLTSALLSAEVSGMGPSVRIPGGGTLRSLYKLSFTTSASTRGSWMKIRSNNTV